MTAAEQCLKLENLLEKRRKKKKKPGHKCFRINIAEDEALGDSFSLCNFPPFN